MSTSSTIHTAARVETCPTWGTDHDGFDDGSSDWHKSKERVIGDHRFYVSTGTVLGKPELFMDDREGIPLDEAKELATSMLLLVEEARA